MIELLQFKTIWEEIILAVQFRILFLEKKLENVRTKWAWHTRIIYIIIVRGREFCSANGHGTAMYFFHLSPFFHFLMEITKQKPTP